MNETVAEFWQRSSFRLLRKKMKHTIYCSYLTSVALLYLLFLWRDRLSYWNVPTTRRKCRDCLNRAMSKCNVYHQLNCPAPFIANVHIRFLLHSNFIVIHTSKPDWRLGKTALLAKLSLTLYLIRTLSKGREMLF